jgi:putative DNA primase/helicase
MKIDFDGINAAALHALDGLLAEWFPNGHREGHEFKIGRISGEPGRSLSINLRTGAWKDFAGDAGGSDPISLLAAIRSCSMKDAAIELGERLRTGIESPGVSAPAKARPANADWTPTLAPEGTALPGRIYHHRFGHPSAVWEYRSADGRLFGAVCRFDLPDGGKDVVPLTWARHADGREQFRWLAFGKPRPLYGLDLLAANPAAGVLIVEGEKAAQAARTICPGVVVTWPGGGKAVKFADWSPLAGRKVVIWPDRDEPGIDAAQAIAKALAPIAASVRVVSPPAGPADGWDLADAVAEGWDRARLIEAIRPKADPVPEPESPQDVVEPWRDEPALPPAAKPQVFAEDRIGDLPFRLLGIDGDAFYYMPDRGQQVVSLTASGHTKNNLMRLAHLNAWEVEYGQGAELTGKAWDQAVNALIQRSQALPKFDPQRIRGRGCWIDGEDVVFHAGDELIVNGTATPIPRFNSAIRAIYEGALEIPVDSGDGADNRSAARLIELCEMMSWERPLYGKLLAGWLAIAPICGALVWRPHVWITGPSGSGKSWSIANIVSPIVGDSAIHVQGPTTEAGLRQKIGCDALPVVFDEAESEDKRGQQRLEGVLELARQASSESKARITKGSASGGAIDYMVRSCFLFASIGVAAVKKADTSRVTVLQLRKNVGPGAQAHFEIVKALWLDTVAKLGFPERIRSRSLNHAKTLRANAETFSAVAVEFTGDKRSADQIGTLLAGAYSLTSTKLATRDFAREWMAKQDWSGFKSEEIDNDENQCLSHLFAASIRYEIEGRGVTRSISEAVQLVEAQAISDDAMRAKGETREALKRHGILVKDGRASIANRHPALERIFADTPWAGAKWRQQLERVAGHEKHEVLNFGLNIRQRAVSVPLNLSH